MAQAPGFQAEVARLQVRRHHADPRRHSRCGERRRHRSARSGPSASRICRPTCGPPISSSTAQQWDEAIASYKSILAKAPALSVINLQIAAAYRNKKDYDNAIAAYNDLLKVDPNNEKAKVGIGQTNLEKGDLAAAASALSQGAQQNASKEIFFTLGEVKPPGATPTTPSSGTRKPPPTTRTGASRC